jgi:hypothetical protein
LHRTIGTPLWWWFQQRVPPSRQLTGDVVEDGVVHTDRGLVTYLQRWTNDHAEE